jgi:hypothetical protein
LHQQCSCWLLLLRCLLLQPYWCWLLVLAALLQVVRVLQKPAGPLPLLLPLPSPQLLLQLCWHAWLAPALHT